MTRVLHLSSVHKPFDVRIHGKECVSLAAAGFDTGFAVSHDRDETVNGVRIHSIPQPSNRLQRMVVSSFRLFRLARAKRADVVHFHDAELIPIGILLSLTGRKVIYDVHEDLPKAILDKQWIPRILRRICAPLVSAAERMAARLCTCVVAATPAIARRFPAEKAVIVQNFPRIEEFASTSRPSNDSDNLPRICYVGGITRSRGAIQMITAMSRVNCRDAVLSVAGPVQTGGLEEEMARTTGFDRVEMLGWQSREQVANLFGICSAGIVLFHPEQNHIEAQPNKLFEYMSAGLPVIASDFPLWRAIVADNDCGILVNPLDPDAIATAIDWVLEHPAEAEAMGKRGRQAVHSTFNWESEAEELLHLYSRIIQ